MELDAQRGLIASILRFIAFDRTSSFTDPTYNAVELIIWTLAEPGIYLIAACLMTYRPFLDKLGSKMKTQGKISRWLSKPSEGSGATDSGRPDRNYSTATSRAPACPTVQHSTSKDKAILLSGISSRTDGFEHLSDVDDYPGQDGRPPRLIPPHDAILRTTNIRMSWDTHGI